MVFRVFGTALVAGLLAGLVSFGLQQARISPLIQQAVHSGSRIHD